MKVEVEKKPPYKAGQWIDPATYDETRLPKGHKCEEGRITRQNRTDSNRPDSIWPEMWAIMTPKEKKEAKLALAPVVASLTSRKTTYLPKMPSMPVMS